MRKLILLLVLLAVPGPAAAITFDEARHLLARTGFGVAGVEAIGELMPLTHAEAVDRILDGVRQKPVLPPPTFISDISARTKVKKMSAEARKAFTKGVADDRKTLKRWWVKEMLATGSPLTERLVLFWHNHFVSESRKVRFSQMMYAQNATFRRHAMGNFADLLSEVSTGPAMLFYLDGHKNVKGRPNENFAREVLELFTLGEGRGYTEFDVREAARAFTGWTIDRRNAEFVFMFRRHDNTNKTFLGQDGNFDGIDILKILLRQKRVAEFITEKLWWEFVSPEPDRDRIAGLADEFRSSGYELRTLLRGLFSTPEFRAPANRGTLVKSPVELVIGTLRLLKFENVEAEKVIIFQRRLGQDLFDPPDVKGWRGHTAWITSITALQREQFVGAAARGMAAAAGVMGKDGMIPPSLFGMPNKAGLARLYERPRDELRRLILAAKPVLGRSMKGRDFRLVFNLMRDPMYQLK